MFPILYETITMGVVPQDNGLGVLSDCISCEVEQVRNSIYELVIQYPASGIHAQDFALMRWVKAKPNFTDNPQLFFIDRIGKVLNGKFTVYCKHISYLLSGYVISEGTANNAASACVLLKNATKRNGEQSEPDFNIETDKVVEANFSIKEPSSVKSWFVGKEGSFLDIYGTADIRYDNFNVNFMLHAGVTEPRVTIRYGKNLLDLSQEIDGSNLYTHVLCFYKNEESGVVSGNKVSTGLTLDVPQTLVLDVSEEYEVPPDAEELTLRAQRYISQNNLTVPANNITLDFVQSGELNNRVDLCDIVSVYYEALGIAAEFKCIRTVWDCLRERYIQTEFGDVKKSLVNTITSNNAALADAKSSAEAAASAVSSKKRVFISEPVPPYDEGDLWVDGGDIRYCAVARASGEFDESDWLLAADYVGESRLEQAIANATSLITGNAGDGNIIVNLNEKGMPYEYIVTDNPDIHNKATRLWRWNIGGLGFSSTGYDGKYALALTPDGKINADLITTGELRADLVTVSHLTASMFEGQKISIGGRNDQSGTFELRNENNVVIGEMTKDGLKFYGEGAVGNRPYVLLNNTVGFAGFSADGTKTFWVSRDEFHMKKCVAENEVSVGGKVKFVPVTITEDGTIINEGIAFVATV